eukprot:7785558-Heterocapsa_arctica.AAC.1
MSAGGRGGTGRDRPVLLRSAERRARVVDHGAVSPSWVKSSRSVSPRRPIGCAPAGGPTGCAP